MFQFTQKFFERCISAPQFVHTFRCCSITVLCHSLPSFFLLLWDKFCYSYTEQYNSRGNGIVSTKKIHLMYTVRPSFACYTARSNYFVVYLQQISKIGFDTFALQLKCVVCGLGSDFHLQNIFGYLQKYDIRTMYNPTPTPF